MHDTRLLCSTCSTLTLKRIVSPRQTVQSGTIRHKDVPDDPNPATFSGSATRNADIRVGKFGRSPDRQSFHVPILNLTFCIFNWCPPAPRNIPTDCDSTGLFDHPEHGIHSAAFPNQK